MAEGTCGMPDELAELFEAAMYKEIASQAFYEAGQAKAQDPGAKALMQELAKEELKHANWLKALKEKGLPNGGWRKTNIPNLRISEYLVGSDKLEGAGLQDTLVVAIKREQQSIEFYLKMMEAMKDETAKRLCQRLIQAEIKHKLKLEILYDDLFYSED